MNLTRLSLSGALAVGLVISGSQLFAQDQNAGSSSSANQSESQTMKSGQHGAWHHGHHMNPDRAVERMTKRYNLTQDQQSKIRTILTGEHQQMMSVRDNTSISKADRWQKMKDIHSDTVAKIEGTLNPQQKEKFELDQKRMRERMEQHHMQHQGHSDMGGGSN